MHHPLETMNIQSKLNGTRAISYLEEKVDNSVSGWQMRNYLVMTEVDREQGFPQEMV